MAHENVLKHVRERESYEDSIYPEVQRRVDQMPHAVFQSKLFSWHRKC